VGPRWSRRGWWKICGATAAACRRRRRSPCGPDAQHRDCRQLFTAADDDDAEFEARLAALKRAKGETPYGEGKKAAREGEKKAAAPSSSKKRQYDFSGETVVFESGAIGAQQVGVSCRRAARRCISACLQLGCRRS